MEIYYTSETLYVKMKNINIDTLSIMQRKVFRIIEDYEINNIVLNIPPEYKSTSDLFNPFIRAFHKKHNGNLRIL
jgi:hypothetical protein